MSGRDVQKLQRWIASAERRMAHAVRAVVMQEDVVASLRAGGRDITTAEALLQSFRAALRLHEDYRERLTRDLLRVYGSCESTSTNRSLHQDEHPPSWAVAEVARVLIIKHGDEAEHVAMKRSWDARTDLNRATAWVDVARAVRQLQARGDEGA